MRRTRAVMALAACVLGAGCGSPLDAEGGPTAPGYDAVVAPLLERHCVSCHTSSGPRLGGVELDRYESALSNGVRNACTSVTQPLVDRFSTSLLPVPKDPPEPRTACRGWAVASMPPGAQPLMDPAEQLALVRWIVAGYPR